MANVEQVVVEAAEKLTNAVNAYGPKATELVLEIGRAAATQDLVYGFVFAAGFVTCVLVAALCMKEVEKRSACDELAPVYFISIMFFGIIGLISGIAAAINLTYVFAWVGLTRPEIYLAAKLLKL